MSKRNKKTARLIAYIRHEVKRQMALAQGDRNFHVLTVTFDNRSLSIPYEAWRPRSEARIPGTWTDPEVPA
jgi:hypothetical protein